MNPAAIVKTGSVQANALNALDRSAKYIADAAQGTPRLPRTFQLTLT
jgi:hypothetical protein